MGVVDARSLCIRKARKAHLGSLVGFSTAHASYSTRATIEASDKFYVSNLLKAQPGETMDIEPFFKYLSDRQGELDKLFEKEKPSDPSKTASNNDQDKSNKPLTRAEKRKLSKADKQATQDNKSKRQRGGNPKVPNRVPNGITKENWNKYREFAKKYKITFIQDICFKKVIDGSCPSGDACDRVHVCPGCNRTQPDSGGHLVWQCPKKRPL